MRRARLRLDVVMEQLRCRGWGAKQLAAAVGRTRRQVDNWIHGRYCPRLDVRAQLAAVLGVGEGELFEDTAA